jgi:methyltransferase-like protein/SAM-dependent methyltransferase
MARIFGLDATPPHNARVLELGCASGGNLIPMALAYPGSHFVGIDLSQRQIEEGNATVTQLGLANLDLRHLSITDVEPSLGKFDYILAHGVYSWVPPAVQEKILDICRDNLNDNGVAYVSYNVFPGWHTRGTIREILCHQTRDVDDPVEKTRLARQHLAFLGNFYGNRETPFHAALAHEIKLLEGSPDTYLLHEYLETFNEPLYFHQFIARAQAKRLQYLAEAEIASMLPARFGPDNEKFLRAVSSDHLELEQQMDFLRTRTFRQTLLCPARHTLDYKMRPDAIPSLYIASPMKPEAETIQFASDQPETFVGKDRPKLTTSSPRMKAALFKLAQHWPLPVHFNDLIAFMHEVLEGSTQSDTADLAQGLLNCYAAGVVEFSAAPPRFVNHVSERPVTTPYIRLRASHGDEVTSLRLESVLLTEPSRIVLLNLNGTNDRQSLAVLVTESLEKNHKRSPTESAHDRALRYIDYILASFAKSALLTA